MFKRFWGVFLVMLPVGALVGLLFAAVVTYVMPKMYESEATIEVRRRETIDSPIGSKPMTPQFFESEIGKIKIRSSLEDVVTHLELEKRWNVDKEIVLQILEAIVITRKIQGTDLVSIRVRHSNKVDARDIAEEVAYAYKLNRHEIESKDAALRMDELNKTIRDQEDKVGESRRVLSAIIRNSIMSRGFNYEIVQGGDNRDHDTLEREKVRLEDQVKSIMNLGGDELMVYASCLDTPDNINRNLYPQYLEFEEKLEGLRKQGLGAGHPTVLAGEDNVAAMKRALDEGVVHLRGALKAELHMVTDRLRFMRGQPSLNDQAVSDAKRDFDLQKEMLKALMLKQLTESNHSGFLGGNIDIANGPVTGESPVSPNVPLNLTLGAGLGLLLSPLIALPVIWKLSRMKSAEAVADF